MRSLVLVPLLLVVATSCDQAKTPAAQATATSTAATTTASKIEKVVFIDQENACDCTNKRIEGTWTALQSVLGKPALPVERIHVDTEKAKAETYTMLRPLMVPPGIYFVDAGDAVVEMLQGEVTADQIAAVLKTE